MTQTDSGPTVSVVVPSGMLGTGSISAEQIAFGLSLGARAVAVDAGSTDSGPAPLATGISKISRDAIKRDIRVMMEVAIPAGVPILIGSCGTAGTDAGVDWTHDIVVELARELGQNPRITLLYSEQSKAVLKDKNARGRIAALPGAPALDDDLIDACDRIVALMGAEPFIEALREGTDIILAGRTTDTAILAAVPLMLGADPAHTWHAAKTAECGGLCTENPRAGGVIFSVGADHFDIRPLVDDNRCTVSTVAAHMLYENSNPFELIEPGVVLNVKNARYEQLDPATVRVTGSTCDPHPYTMKLEGASRGDYQTVLLVGIEDPAVMRDVPLFLDRLSTQLHRLVERTFPDEQGWSLSLRPYGWNAVSGAAVAEGFIPREIGLLLVVTAHTQEAANRIARSCNPTLFHFPIRPGIPMPSYAYPFSPAEMDRGQIYHFRLHHVVSTEGPFELIRKTTFKVRDEVAA